MADQWAWHKAALAGQKVTISESKVESGFFYARASKEGGRIPIAIWRMPDGIFNCRVGTKSAHTIESEDQAARRWTYIANNPVSREAYKAAYEAGVWEDGTPTVAPEAPTPAKGDNLPTDPFERLQAEISDKMASAAKWMKEHPEAKTQAEADYATNLQRELAALNKRADAMFTAEKEPHLEAGRAVDEKFRFRETVAKIATSLKGIFGKFMAAEEARQKAEAQKKYQAELAKADAERKRIEAERERLMQNDPIAALTSPEPEMPELPLAPAPVKVQTGGGIGNRAGLKSVWTPIIEDYDAALQHLKNAPDIIDALEKVVNAIVKAQKGSTSIPGVKVVEQRKAA